MGGGAVAGREVIPAVGADVGSGELIAAQLPQVLVRHDASKSSQVRPCSRQPPRGNQDLGRGQDAHQDSMGTCGARLPPPQLTIVRRDWHYLSDLWVYTRTTSLWQPRRPDDIVVATMSFS